MIINILTIFTINMPFTFFEKLKLLIFYKKSNILNANCVAIYERKMGKDKIISIEKIKNITLEHDSEEFLKKYCGIENNNSIKIFNYKMNKFYFSSKQFLPISFNINNYEEIKFKFSKGLKEKEVSNLRNLFGKCMCDITVESFFEIALKELSNPFYVFQLFSLILWCFFENYISYSLIILFATIISITLSVKETRENLENIRKMENYSCSVNIFRKKVEFK